MNTMHRAMFTLSMTTMRTLPTTAMAAVTAMARTRAITVR